MKHHIDERFQGIWWGGIIGQAQLNSTKVCSQLKWLMQRQQVAQLLLRVERIETGDTQLSLAIQQILRISREIDNSNHADNRADWTQQSLDDHAGQGTSDHCELLSLLPLIIFLSDHQKLLTQIIHQYDLRPVSQENLEIDQDILIWSYLVTFCLNDEFELEQFNFASVTKSIVDRVESEETSLTTKLQLAVEAAVNGLGLQQLVKKMLATGSTQQTAIALAWYLFITTPNNFRLSIQRTINLPLNLAWLTAALTGTLSGAYNGLIGIPWSWRSTICQNPDLDSENKIIRQLLGNWLGIYLVNNQRDFPHPQLHAVANCQAIQPRKNLKIISQKSRL